MNHINFPYILFCLRDLCWLPAELIYAIITMIISNTCQRIKLIPTRKFLSVIMDGIAYKIILSSVSKFHLHDVTYIGYTYNHWIAMLSDRTVHSDTFWLNGFITKNKIFGINKIVCYHDIVFLQENHQIHLVRNLQASLIREKIISVPFLIKKIKVTKNDIFIIDSDNNVHVCMGLIYDFYMGLCFHPNYKISVDLFVSNMIKFACITSHVIFIDKNHNIFMYRRGETTRACIQLDNVISIQTNEDLSLFLTKNGTLYEIDNKKFLCSTKVNIKNIHKIKCSKRCANVLTSEGIYVWQSGSDKALIPFKDFI